MTSSFKDTRWSLVENSRGREAPARAALGELCAIYYSPVSSFIASWCRDAETARDLTQSFFARVLQGDEFDGVDRERGRFRHYLLGAVKHFLNEQAAREGRIKRGAHHVHVLVEDTPLTDENLLPPDAKFDRAWALTLLERAMQGLQTEMESAGKGKVFATLKPWLAGTATQGEQLAAAQVLAISETAIRVAVHRLRKRFRELIEQEALQTLGSDVDVGSELRLLLGVL